MTQVATSWLVYRLTDSFRLVARSSGLCQPNPHTSIDSSGWNHCRQITAT
ncbi:hypothetical protein [Nostoc sp. ChiSLP03a]|nr:hypothetical protein [Nostoc sp. ChiSLP03a]MDZ8212689.1 hypothetical protein [Nostoc sp. ChiSLP03a]